MREAQAFAYDLPALRGYEMRARWLAVIAVLCAPFALADDDHSWEPSWPKDLRYPQGDPYYTDAFDRLAACAKVQAAAFTYDYDRPEISASMQTARFMRARCGAETAALAMLMSPMEKTGGPHELTGALDAVVMASAFFTPDIWDPPADHGAARPGTPVLTDQGRTTYLAAEVPFRPGELVAVNRIDAWSDDEHPYSAYRMEHFGRGGAWTYSYRLNFDGWEGRVESDGVSVKVKCFSDYHDREQAFKYDELGRDCDLTTSNRLIAFSLVGTKFGHSAICNPGRVSVRSSSGAPSRPPSPDLRREVPREGRLTIDGDAPVTLPDAHDCFEGHRTAAAACAGKAHRRYIHSVRRYTRQNRRGVRRSGWACARTGGATAGADV